MRFASLDTNEMTDPTDPESVLESGADPWAAEWAAIEGAKSPATNASPAPVVASTADTAVTSAARLPVPTEATPAKKTGVGAALALAGAGFLVGGPVGAVVGGVAGFLATRKKPASTPAAKTSSFRVPTGGLLAPDNFATGGGSSGGASSGGATSGGGTTVYAPPAAKGRPSPRVALPARAGAKPAPAPAKPALRPSTRPTRDLQFSTRTAPATTATGESTRPLKLAPLPAVKAPAAIAPKGRPGRLDPRPGLRGYEVTPDGIVSDDLPTFGVGRPSTPDFAQNARAFAAQAAQVGQPAAPAFKADVPGHVAAKFAPDMPVQPFTGRADVYASTGDMPRVNAPDAGTPSRAHNPGLAEYGVGLVAAPRFGRR